MATKDCKARKINASVDAGVGPAGLTLQLHFSFDVGAARFGLMSPPPQ
jgi:hypothetical protein